ncbi:hypothetical protein [Pelagibius sp.]|uniref:hypothetical protein n=1 Tax=Pelagibius sp. TaxID=1931238 RepID=UPI0026338BDA|nr:hypothetical protein [Pelagibius sp.]
MAAQQSPPSGAIADLPVSATVVASFAVVFGQLGLVAQAAKGAFIVLVAGSLITLMLPAGSIDFLLILISFAVISHFGVNWCRVMLLGPQGLPARSLTWGEIHWRFFGYVLLMFFIMMLLTIPLSVISSLLAAAFGLMSSAGGTGPALAFVFAVIFLGMLYVLARLGFIFPAVAVGERYSLGLSWQHTAGQGARMMMALFAVGFPITVAQLVITELLSQIILGFSLFASLPTVALPGEGFPAGEASAAIGPVTPPSAIARIAFNLISAVVNFLSFAVIFSLLCLAFRTCTGWVPAGAGNLPTVPSNENEREEL